MQKIWKFAKIFLFNVADHEKTYLFEHLPVSPE